MIRRPVGLPLGAAGKTKYSLNERTSGMNGTQRANIKPGLKVGIVLKCDQGSGKLTEGTVKDILTNSPNHPHGIKVRLADGQIGRVKEIK
jgi:uncharacterized repeat protein (TIGR03833 family)